MIIKILITIVIILNIYSFILMAMDKRKSKKKKWRVKESKLFLIALLGGAAGILVGMNIFKHKTLHNKFIIGIPLIILLNIIMYYWIFRIIIRL